MPDLPTTEYARTPDGVYIAYQVWGEGPDLVVVPGFVSHVEAMWDYPNTAGLLRRLGSFARVLTFDKRGTGLSDRTDAMPDTDQRMLDLLAVMDAAEIERATIMGVSEGGAMSMLFAATYPERVTGLALYGSYASLVKGPDHPFGFTHEELARTAEVLEEGWGTGVGLHAWSPSTADDAQTRSWWAQFQRLSASPGAARRLIYSYNLIDVRPALPLIHAPTLVIHRETDRMVPVELGRELAEGIPGARLELLPGSDHLLWTIGWRSAVDLIEEFVTGRPTAAEPDRFLATVLFTDIVGSTEQLGRVGDDHWREVMDGHDRLVERQVSRHGGRVVHGTGDGVLAVFDGPTRAIRAAMAIVDGAGGLDIEVRAGLHTGEILERTGDVAGMAVHVAARVAAEAGPAEVLVSRTTVDLVAGSGIEFIDRGEHELKGVEGTWRLYEAER